jgi:transposase
LLEQYYFLDEQIARQTELLQQLSKTELYRERVEILTTIPGIGIVAAMELLLELQDITRFQRADQLAAYVGLTPSQYTSADKVRMGRITCVGKNSLRAMLIQASWTLIRKDGVMREKYDRLKSRSGGKRAIVAIARSLLIRMRRLLLDNNPYVVGLVATN